MLLLNASSGMAVVISATITLLFRPKRRHRPVFSAEGQKVSALQFDLEWDSVLDVKMAIGGPVAHFNRRDLRGARGTRQTRSILIARVTTAFRRAKWCGCLSWST